MELNIITTYSSKSNALRAAKKMEGEWEQLKNEEGRWFNSKVQTAEVIGSPEPILSSHKEVDAMHILINSDLNRFVIAHENPYVLADLAEVFFQNKPYYIEALSSPSFLKGVHAIECNKFYANLFGKEPEIVGPKMIEKLQFVLLKIIEMGIGVWKGDEQALRRQANSAAPNQNIPKGLILNDLHYENLPQINYENISQELAEMLAKYKETDYNLISKFTSISNEENTMVAPKTPQTPEQIEAAKAAAAAKAAEKAAKKEAEKAAAAAAKEAAKAEKAAAKAAKAIKEPKAPKIEQNGVKRPHSNTLCGKAWEIFDNVAITKGETPSIKDILNHEDSKGLNEGNLKCEFARWKKFKGLTKERKVA